MEIFYDENNTHSGGKSIGPIAKDPHRQMWFTVIQILHRGYHARGTKNDSHYRRSVLVSSIHLFWPTQGPGKELAMELEEDCGMGKKGKGLIETLCLTTGTETY